MRRALVGTWRLLVSRIKAFDFERGLVSTLLVLLNVVGPVVIAKALQSSSDPAISRLLDDDLVPEIPQGVKSLNDLVIQLYTMYIALVALITQSLYYTLLPQQPRWSKLLFMGSSCIALFLLIFVFSVGWVGDNVRLEPYLFGNRAPIPFLSPLYTPPFWAPVTILRVVFGVWTLMLGFLAGLTSQRKSNNSPTVGAS